uniref:Integrase catalytic domain-containing protein n=1 Tax=Megaselia scalaris TaxID=36166 RepID=T1GH80_MEGSC
MAADLFKGKKNGKSYLIVTDFFSRYGGSDEIRIDGRPQYQGYFSSLLRISPYYSQSNREAESPVKIAKIIIDTNEDILDALLKYRSTLSNGFSPAELFIGRKLKT